MDLNRKPKALFIMQLPPPFHGTSMMNDMIAKSSKIRNEVIVDLIPLFYNSNSTRIGAFSLSKAWITIKYFLLIFYFIMKNEYSFVYYTLSPIGLPLIRDSILLLIVKLFNQKLILHLHGKGIKNASKNSGILRYLYKWIFNKSTVILLSKKLYYDVEQYVKYNNCRFLSNGINSKMVGYLKKEDQLGELKCSFSAVYLSSLIRSKGILDFLRSIAIVKKAGYKIRATVIGGEQDISISYLHEVIIKLGLKDNVKILGEVTGDKKERLLSAHDIFILPTFYPNECFPLVILEAMKYGLPVISTSEGAISEIVDNNINGFIIDKKRPDTIAEKIIYLINNKGAFIKMGVEARKKFLNSYRHEVFKYKFVGIIRELCP